MQLSCEFSVSDLGRIFISNFSTSVSAGFHSGHFYSVTLSATAFRALEVGYAATREKVATPWIELGSVASWER